MVIFTLVIAMRRMGMSGDDYQNKDAMQIVLPFLRHMNVATACIAELCIALCIQDRLRLMAIMLNLYKSWRLAEQILSNTPCAVDPLSMLAQDMLRECRVFGAAPLAQAWALIRNHEVQEGPQSGGGPEYD
jgi:hypothetical protein